MQFEWDEQKISKEHIVKYKKGMPNKTDWARVNAMTDDEIDYSDNPATG